MIESVDENNLEDLLPLIRAYQEFYKIDAINDDCNRKFFSQFGKDSELGCQFLYRDDSGTAVGFATIYFSFVSSIPAKVGIMNDLYTIPKCRSKGIGRSLINHCLQYAVSRGSRRIQWITATDNVQAQRLYDSVCSEKSSRVSYSLK